MTRYARLVFHTLVVLALASGMTAFADGLWMIDTYGEVYLVDASGTLKSVAKDWKRASHLAVLGENAWIIDGADLFRMDRAGKSQKVASATAFKNAKLLAAAGGALWLVDTYGEILKVDASGNRKGVGKGWKAATHLVAAKDALWLIDSGRLNRKPFEGKVEETSADHKDTRFLAAVGTELLTIEKQGTLFRSSDGKKWAKVGAGGYRDARLAASSGGHLWVVDGVGQLYKVDPTGKREPAGEPRFKNAKLLAGEGP